MLGLTTCGRRVVDCSTHLHRLPIDRGQEKRENYITFEGINEIDNATPALAQSVVDFELAADYVTLFVKFIFAHLNCLQMLAIL